MGSYVFESVVESPRLDVAGSRVYLAGGRFGLRIVDMTDPTRPVLLASDPFRTVLGLQVTGTLLWLADGANLRTFECCQLSRNERQVLVGGELVKELSGSVAVLTGHAKKR